MKKALSYLLLTAALTLSCGFAAYAEGEAEESPFTVDISTAIYSDYMFRGQNLYDGTAIQPSIQPHYSLGEYGNLSGLFFMHLSADRNTQVDRFTEMDLGVIYDVELKPFIFSAGHYWYTYDDDIHSTREFFVSVAIQTMLTPTLTYYRDYVQFDYNYYELGLSHTFEASGEGAYNLTPFVNFGFANDSEKVYADDGLVQTTVGLSTDLPVNDLTLTPTLAYTFESDETTVNHFWFGMNLGYSF